jgi:hypothetical protein
MGVPPVEPEYQLYVPPVHPEALSVTDPGPQMDALMGVGAGGIAYTVAVTGTRADLHPSVEWRASTQYVLTEGAARLPVVYVNPVVSLVGATCVSYQSITSFTSAVADNTTGPAPHRLPLVTIGSPSSGVEVKVPDTGKEGQFVLLLVITTVYEPITEDEKVFTFPGLVDPDGTVHE